MIKRAISFLCAMTLAVSMLALCTTFASAAGSDKTINLLSSENLENWAITKRHRNGALNGSAYLGVVDMTKCSSKVDGWTGLLNAGRLWQAGVGQFSYGRAIDLTDNFELLTTGYMYAESALASKGTGVQSYYEIVLGEYSVRVAMDEGRTKGEDRNKFDIILLKNGKEVGKSVKTTDAYWINNSAGKTGTSIAGGNIRDAIGTNLNNSALAKHIRDNTFAYTHSNDKYTVAATTDAATYSYAGDKCNTAYTDLTVVVKNGKLSVKAVNGDTVSFSDGSKTFSSIDVDKTAFVSVMPIVNVGGSYDGACSGKPIGILRMVATVKGEQKKANLTVGTSPAITNPKTVEMNGFDKATYLLPDDLNWNSQGSGESYTEDMGHFLVIGGSSVDLSVGAELGAYNIDSYFKLNFDLWFRERKLITGPAGDSEVWKIAIGDLEITFHRSLIGMTTENEGRSIYLKSVTYKGEQLAIEGERNFDSQTIVNHAYGSEFISKNAEESKSYVENEVMSRVGWMFNSDFWPNNKMGIEIEFNRGKLTVKNTTGSKTNTVSANLNTASGFDAKTSLSNAKVVATCQATKDHVTFVSAMANLKGVYQMGAGGPIGQTQSSDASTSSTQSDTSSTSGASSNGGSKADTSSKDSVNANSDRGEKSNSGTVIIIVVVACLLVAGGAAAFILLRKKQSAETAAEDSAEETTEDPTEE